MANEEENSLSLDDFSEDSLLDLVTPEVKTEEEEEEEKKSEEKEEEETPEDTPAEEQEEEEIEEKTTAKEEEEETETSFWDDVEEITGVNYEVDYGDTDPESAAGAALREEAVKKKAVEDNLTYLEKSYPEAFEILTHVANGGKVTDLVKPQEIDYTKIEIQEENLNQQKAILREYYKSKGLTETKVQRMIEDDEDSEEGLLHHAKLALQEKKEEQLTRAQEVMDKQKKTKEAQDQRDKEFSQTLSSAISNGKIGNFKIPKAEGEKFYNYVLQHVHRNGEGYVVSIPTNGENLENTLQQMFFSYKKGDLSKYVATEAKTQNTKRLKRNLKKEKSVAEEGQGKRKRSGKELPTLGAFEVD